MLYLSLHKNYAAGNCLLNRSRTSVGDRRQIAAVSAKAAPAKPRWETRHDVIMTG